MALRNPRLSTHVDHLVKLHKGVDQVDLSVDVGEKLLSEILWEESASLREEALKTYFVQGIGNGSLNPTAFGGYMVQDSVYCYRAKESIDVALSKATQPELKAYLQHESGSYESYYKSLWKKWYIGNANGISLSPACQAYADYEHIVATTMDTIYFIVAMTPCMKLWPWLGQQLQGENHGVYDEWYNDNFDPNYHGYRKLDAFVDYAYMKGTINQSQASNVFMRCMQGEVAFFSTPKEMI